MTDIPLQQFSDLDRTDDVAAYIWALEAFDAAAQIQQLKSIERRRTGIGPGSRLLDLGCGFGLETLRVARRVGPLGFTAGLDKSAHFITEAKRRAAAARLSIAFAVGDALELPYPDASFDGIRAERLLIYLDDWQRALAEMLRVVRPGGTVAIIEPDMGTVSINLRNGPMVRRATAHEADTAVAQSCLPGPLLAALRSGGLAEISVDTRVVVFPQDLGDRYFSGVARRAAADGALSKTELEDWLQELQRLRESESLFGTIGYFLFTARSP